MSRPPHNYSQCLAAAICLALAGTEVVQADSVSPISPAGPLLIASSWFDTAAGQTPSPVYGNPNSTTGGVAVNDLTGNPASVYTFGNSFSNPHGSYAGFTVNDATQGPESIGFLDSYVIQVPATIAASSIFSLNLTSSLGLSDLTMRLYGYPANNYIINATGPVNGAVPSDNWSLSNNASGTNPVASSTLSIGSLQQGTYVVEVAGLETGSSMGTYSGQLDLTPVPLPAAAWLMVSGLGALGAFRRRIS